MYKRSVVLKLALTCGLGSSCRSAKLLSSFLGRQDYLKQFMKKYTQGQRNGFKTELIRRCYLEEYRRNNTFG